MMKRFASLGLGVLFGVGLVLSGMTDPAKVRAFLAFGTSRWDPSLAFVMGSAVITCGALYAIARRRKPIPEAFVETRSVDSRLVTGAAIFGVGWGIVGACPGPAIVLLGAGSIWSLVFVIAMAIGTRLASIRVSSRSGRETYRPST